MYITLCGFLFLFHSGQLAPEFSAYKSAYIYIEIVSDGRLTC